MEHVVPRSIRDEVATRTLKNGVGARAVHQLVRMLTATDEIVARLVPDGVTLIAT